jgi:hypothetical protein
LFFCFLCFLFNFNYFFFVDQTQVVHEVTLALFLAFCCTLTRLTPSSTIGVLAVNSVNSFLSDLIVVASQLFSSFQTSSSTLDGALDGLHDGGRGEAGSAVGCADDGGDNGLHDEKGGCSDVQKFNLWLS